MRNARIGALVAAAMASLLVADSGEAQRRSGGRGSDVEDAGSWEVGGGRRRAPADAVPAEPGSDLLVCRVRVGSAWVPGALSEGVCITVHREAIVQEENCQVLSDSSKRLQWEKAIGARQPPSTAVFAGRDQGQETYICRTGAGGKVALGRVTDSNRCSFVMDGSMQTVTDFDYLVKQEVTTSTGSGRVHERRGSTGCPEPTQVMPSKTTLWPNDDGMQMVTLRGAGDYTITKIEQDECVFGLGDRDSGPDGRIIGDKNAQLRRQRADAPGDGRIYTIHYEVANCPSGTVDVCVPLTSGGSCIDSTVRYDSTSSNEAQYFAQYPNCKASNCENPTVVIERETTSRDGKWYHVRLDGIDTYTVSKVWQDECRNGVVSGKITRDKVELLDIFHPGGDGIVYSIEYSCGGKTWPVVKFPLKLTDGTSAVDSGGNFDSTRAVLDPECCAATVTPAVLDSDPTKFQSVTVKTHATSTVTGITQDECVGDQVDGRIVTGGCELRKERFEDKDGRVYGVKYTCGGRDHTVDVQVPKTGNTARDSGQRYDSTEASRPGTCDFVPPVVSCCFTLGAPAPQPPAPPATASSGSACEKKLCLGATSSVRPPAPATPASSAVAGKVTICHIPPGNPANANTLEVDASAVAAHIAHGDSEGACGTGQELVKLDFAIWASDDQTPSDQLKLKVVGVTSDEATSAPGLGSTLAVYPDATVNGLDVWVRKEAVGTGDGRVYVVTVSAEDAGGNVGTSTCEVMVGLPDSQGKDVGCATVKDSGQRYDATKRN